MNNKEILYVTTDLCFIEGTKAGGDIVQISHLNILNQLGFSIKILLLNFDEFTTQNPSIIESYKNFTFNSIDISVDKMNLFVDKNEQVNLLKKLNYLTFNITTYYYKFVNKKNIVALEEYVFNKNPLFVWAQWSYPGLLFSKAKIDKKIFYVHHDWQYKLVEFKNVKSLKTAFLKFAKKRIEKKLIKNVDGIISLSNTDSLFFEKNNIPSIYLPITYDEISEEKITKTDKETPSLIHLGNLNSTANRVGLKDFLIECWPEVKSKIKNVKLEVIGAMPLNDNQLIQLLNNDKQIIIHSFVKDLQTVIYPLDIHIIPWKLDTGTRTRIPLILKNKQCLVARKEGVINIKEIENNKNALLSNSWNKFILDIEKAFNNKELRKEISSEGYITYKNNFIHKTQVEKLSNFLKMNLK